MVIIIPELPWEDVSGTVRSQTVQADLLLQANQRTLKAPAQTEEPELPHNHPTQPITGDPAQEITLQYRIRAVAHAFKARTATQDVRVRPLPTLLQSRNTTLQTGHTPQVIIIPG